MCRLLIAGTVVLVLSLTMAPIVGADATTSPGQTSVFSAHQGFDACCQVVLKGKIATGLAGHVLMVAATFHAVNTSDCSPTDVQIFPPKVNGVLTNPDAFGLISASAHCDGGCPGITGTYWLDLDAAEAANPGTFIGHPLRIKLLGQWFGVNCDILDSLTMSAVMQSR